MVVRIEDLFVDLIQRKNREPAEGRTRSACRRHRRQRIIVFNNEDDGPSRLRRTVWVEDQNVRENL